MTASKSLGSPFVTKPLRKIVNARGCPRCNAKPGLPCYNLMYFEYGDRGTISGARKKRKRRHVYQNYIHAERRREPGVFRTSKRS